MLENIGIRQQISSAGSVMGTTIMLPDGREFPFSGTDTMFGDTGYYMTVTNSPSPPFSVDSIVPYDLYPSYKMLFDNYRPSSASPSGQYFSAPSANYGLSLSEQGDLMAMGLSGPFSALVNIISYARGESDEVRYVRLSRASALDSVALFLAGAKLEPSPQIVGLPEAAAIPKGSANPITRSAASWGSTLHFDKPGMLPDQLRAQYPNTRFEFTKPGVAGQDVRVTGGDHPSSYGTSSWPEGVNYGDFKPGTTTGAKTFRYDQKNKWNDRTHYLPYDPVTGKLLPH